MEFLSPAAARLHLPALTGLLVLLVVGCGIQLGRFTTSGRGSQCLLSPGAGVILIVEGEYRRPMPRDSPPPVLYLLIFCPGVTNGPSGYLTDYDTFVSRFGVTWGTGAAASSVRVDWDRKRDLVSVADRTFRREKGNVFVIRREPDRRFLPLQLPSLPCTLDCAKVLKHVKSELPQDSTIAGLTILNSDQRGQ